MTRHPDPDPARADVRDRVRFRRCVAVILAGMVLSWGVVAARSYVTALAATVVAQQAALAAAVLTQQAALEAAAAAIAETRRTLEARIALLRLAGSVEAQLLMRADEQALAVHDQELASGGAADLTVVR